MKYIIFTLLLLSSCISIGESPEDVGYIIGSAYELNKDHLSPEQRQALEISYSVLNHLAGQDTVPATVDSLLAVAGTYAGIHGAPPLATSLAKKGIRETWLRLTRNIAATDAEAKLKALRRFRDGIDQAIKDAQE